MKEKIKKVLIFLFKVILFWAIIIFVGYMASSQDPEINLLIRIVGFIAIFFLVGKAIYPEIIKKPFSDSSNL